MACAAVACALQADPLLIRRVMKLPRSTSLQPAYVKVMPCAAVAFVLYDDDVHHDVQEEVCMRALLILHLHLSSPVLATDAYSWSEMVL